jgi:hypothetical protein
VLSNFFKFFFTAWNGPRGECHTAYSTRRAVLGPNEPHCLFLAPTEHNNAASSKDTLTILSFKIFEYQQLGTVTDTVFVQYRVLKVQSY